ncbi:MAG: PAS domain-containing protein, partial [Desulfobacteraceae bacterium]|nr:PAS domain-containing protein [Desulfobacteraceae bacterium]
PPAASVKPSLRELTETTLLQEVVPAGALVTAGGDIVYLHGRTGMFLELAPGEAGVNNILKMAREGLKHHLAVALHKAAETRETVRAPGLRVKTNGDFCMLNLTVRPVAPGMAAPAQGKAAAATETSLFLVILQDVPVSDVVIASSGGVEADASDEDVDVRITVLKQELRNKDEYLQTTNEELETSNEELRSSNEEMQSVNEELQSTNEELETSKEELQSTNEELATVNSELQTKVSDLSRANNDMNNLLAGTGIGTVFVDHQLHILRFTPAACRLINLISTDVGRPVGHIVSNFKDYDHFPKDVQAVLDTLVSKKAQVQTKDGRWYSMAIHPYRTLENVIEGAVITFADITETRQTDEAYRTLEQKYTTLSEKYRELSAEKKNKEEKP